MVTKTCDFKQYATYVSALKQLKIVAHIYIYIHRQTERERPALFWVITQQVVVISQQRFGTTYQTHPQGSRIFGFFLEP